MKYAITGSCHCHNLSFELATDVPPDTIRARACDCSFCRLHGARNWSDPAGSVTIRVADEEALQRYRFGLRTADFLVCRNCGAYLGALLADGQEQWATLNLRLTELAVEETPASYGAEDTESRIGRRKRGWTPATVVIESD